MGAEASSQAVGSASPAQRSEAITPRREAQLVRRAQGGDALAVEELFAAHWGMCHRLAWLITHDRAAAEDVAQEALVAAIGALDRFDRSRRLGPWLRTIVARRAIDHARARSARRELAADAAAEPIAADGSDPAALPAPLLDALARLGVDRRAVVVMRFLLDLTPREIAHALDLPVGTVNSRMRRGLDELRELTEAGDG